jgi:cytochrome c550
MEKLMVSTFPLSLFTVKYKMFKAQYMDDIHKGGLIMNRNPIIPFILIFAFGIGLVFFLSMEGLNNADEKAEEHKQEEGAGGEGGGEAAEGGAFDPEAKYQESCVSCHGGNYEGGAGPALKGTALSKDEIKETIANGKGMMPPGLVAEENLDAMADWIKSLK